MTRSQKILTFAALAFFCASIALAPWADKRTHYTYQPMFLAPSGYHLQWQNLIVEWLALGILYGWLFWLLKHTELTLDRAIWIAVIALVIVTVAWVIRATNYGL